MNHADRTLIQAIQCENPKCRQVIMRIWKFQGRRQCENVSCSCDNALGEALHQIHSRTGTSKPA